MKKINNISLIGILALTFLFGCEPFEDSKPEAGIILPPAESEMDFSISPGDDDFHFNVDHVSPTLNGIYTVTFDFGNGSKVNNKSGVAYYPLPGDYTITMTIKTNSGSTSISKTHTTTETDYSIFTDPIYVALTGGVNDADGKTWMVDAESQGHFGVGSTGSDGLEWWSATPFTKDQSGAYDDEVTFKLDGFNVTYDNKGVSFVKGYMKDDPNLSSVYLNPRLVQDDWDVDYQTPVSGTWSITERDGKNYLVIDSEKPIFFGLDVGALNNEYEIVNITENTLELTCFSAYENWTKWHFLMINKEYERPEIEFEVNMSEGADINSYDVSLSVINVPGGESIDKISVDFGNGNMVETTDLNEVISNVYMRKGSYMVTVTTTTSLGEEVTTLTADVVENHPDYEEFQLDQVVMYADFSEIAMAPVEGENCLVAVADNPNRIYPNKSANVAFYSKTDQQWANAFMRLPSGYRFDLRLKHTFSIKVYGKAGDQVLLKLENTDRGGNAWQTGTADLIYTIQEDNTWEIATYDFSGVSAGWDWTGDIFTADVVTDENFNHDFYNVVRIMLNPGVGEGTHEFYFDELAGPHVEGLKSAQIR